MPNTSSPSGSDRTATLVDVLAIVPSILWFLLAAAVFWRHRRSFGELLDIAVWRFKAGAPLKVSVFELGAVQVSPLSKVPLNDAAVRRDDGGDFYRQRQALRDNSLFLVHRIAPSTENGQLYDVLVYLVPGLRHGSLLDVTSVEYYFSNYWNRNIFTSTDRASAFSISTSAFAPFTCTARVKRANEDDIYLHRYIDFEMGIIGLTVRKP
jgi:hypothetical protein